MSGVKTYGNLALRPGGKTWVMTGIPPHVAIRLKQLFPRIRKDQVDEFLFPNDQLNCADLEWFGIRYALSMSDEDRDTLRGGRQLFETQRAELERILTPDYTPPAMLGLKPGMALRPYQSQAIDIAYRRHSLLLGDDIGLGKTEEGLGFCLMPGVLPAAVVVQTHLQGQWAERAAKFTNLRVHKISKSKPYDLPEADIYIFKYSSLIGWIDVFKNQFFKTVIYDEIQELRRGSESMKGQAAYVLSINAQWRIGLSATPIINYGDEIFNIMRCIEDGILGSKGDFDREWLGGSERVVKDPEALGTFLREQHVFLRRTKRDVGQFMPPINKIIEIVDTDEKALQDIADLAKQLALKVATGSFMERGQAGRELDLMVRHATGVAKARPVAAYVRILLEAGIPILLAGWHREVYSTWLKELADFNPVMYTGSESPAQKESAKKSFVEGRTNLFIMSLRSGAGLDGLQSRCSTVVFGELDWSGKIMEQLCGRLDREGQKDPVTAIYLNSDDGSDPPMVELLGLKASQASGIVDPGAELAPVYSDDSRMKMLARRYLDKKTVKEMDARPVEVQAAPDVAALPAPVPAGGPKQMEMEV